MRKITTLGKQILILMSAMAMIFVISCSGSNSEAGKEKEDLKKTITTENALEEADKLIKELENL
ncbi:MAG: hypothetical protein JJT78_03595 [Leptospira sp.]|nr:hypothetical protein [Leptospira sp.]